MSYIKDVLSYFFSKKSHEPLGMHRTPRKIRKVGVFNRYEFVQKNYYGLCGTKTVSVDICVGIATFDSDIYRMRGGCQQPSSIECNNIQVPDNYRLIKHHFIRAEIKK